MLKFDVIYPSLQTYRRLILCSNVMVMWYLQTVNLAFFSSFDDNAKHVKIQTCLIPTA